MVYEDNHLLVVNKRPSDIVQGDKTGDTPLSEVVREWLREKYNKPGNVFTGVVHRLDRPVSGVVVFAKTSKALSRLNSMFKSKDVQKTYLAAVCAMPEKPAGRLVDHMIKNSAKNKSRVVSNSSKNTRESVLSYRLIGESERYYFLEVHPETGRHHQIRVQLSAMGCPIKGDLKYGAPRSNKDASIHLHAWKIRFIHPVQKTPLEVTAPLPDEPVWNALAELIG